MVRLMRCNVFHVRHRCIHGRETLSKSPHQRTADLHTAVDKERPDIIVDGQSGHPLDKNVSEWWGKMLTKAINVGGAATAWGGGGNPTEPESVKTFL